MKTMTAVAIVLCGALGMFCLAPSVGQPVERKPDGPASTVSEANFATIKAGKGTMSEADAVALLGRPDRFTIESDGVLEMVWEDVNRVRVEFVGGKAAFLWGQFSQKFPSETVSLTHFRNLRKGMTEAEAHAIMGEDFEKHQGPRSVHGNVDAIEDLTVRDGATLFVWQRLRRLKAQFTDGKVSGYSWGEWGTNKK